MSKIQAVRGMNDILPQQIASWRFLEEKLRQLAINYGYQEIRLPIVERTELFKRTIGEVTDIVEKEMYSFVDYNGDSLSLRPEGTAGCVRAGIEHGLFYNQQQRLWYMGPIFRHERPQKGRYRQFHQFGVEAFGMPGPDIDAELIFMGARLWRQLGLNEYIHLQLNTLGNKQVRQEYRHKLVQFLEKHHAELDEDSQRRLMTNPLRILDSKNPQTQALLQQAPSIYDCLDAESANHFQGLCVLLDAANIKYTVNPKLVRGLDYYSHTVFEWVTDKLGAQGTVCAGGRFNSLVEQLGGDTIPAIGFALGMERIIALLEDLVLIERKLETVHAYLIMVGDTAQSQGLTLAEKLRDALPNLQLICNVGNGSFKSQFKRADKSNALVALILGEEELAKQHIAIKFLREEKPQINLPIVELINFLQTIC